MRRLCRTACLITGLTGWSCFQVVIAEDFPFEEIVSGIYLNQGVHEQMSLANLGAIGNSGFIVGAHSVAVIDPGGSLKAGEKMKKAIRDLTDLPINYLVLTHFHPDHVAGAMAFKDVENIIAHENYSRALAQRAQFYLDRFNELLPGSAEEVFRLPSQTVSIGTSLSIDLGERKLSLTAYPLAHTDNDVTVYDEKTNSLWASDLIFEQRTPSLDGSLNGWLDVLSGLSTVDYTVIIPGHGKPGKSADLLTPQVDYLEQLRDNIRAKVNAGVALSVVLEHHDADAGFHPHWKLFSAQHGSNLAKAYSELEWE